MSLFQISSGKYKQDQIKQDRIIKKKTIWDEKPGKR